MGLWSNLVGLAVRDFNETPPGRGSNPRSPAFFLNSISEALKTIYSKKIMIEQLNPLSEIKGLDTLVQHFRQEYGEPFLQQIEERKLRINVSLTPQEAILQWKRDIQLPDFYVLSAIQGCITGYKYNGKVLHNKEVGVCYVPINQEKYATLRIELNYLK